MIDLLLLAIVALVTWCVAGEGGWDAALICLSVLFAALLAMNFFEPTANFLASSISSSSEWQGRWDIIALVGLFALFVTLFRLATERLSTEKIPLNELANNIIRWGGGAATGYITMAFLMTALHTAPLPREFLGFKPERNLRTGPVSRLGPDYQWLGFTQRVSEYALRNGAGYRVFDGPAFNPADPAAKDGQPQLWPSFPIRYATRRESYASATASSGGTQGQLIRRGERTSGPGAAPSNQQRSGGTEAPPPSRPRSGPGF